MIRRSIALLTIIAFLCATNSIAYADPPVAPTPTGKIAALKEGQRAPFQGVLLDPAAYAQIRAHNLTLSDYCELDIKTALARQEALFDMRMAILNAQLESERTRRIEIITIKDSNIAYLEKQLLNNSQPTYSEAWFAGGIVAGALITIGIGFAIAEAQH